jgi:hypothetical protein
LKRWDMAALLLVSAANFAHAQSAGRIVGIKGTAYLRAAPNTKPETLTPKHDLNRSLSYDDEISCKKGAQVEILLTGGVPYEISGLPTSDVSSLSPWTPLPHLSTPAVAEMTDYFRRGGRERGERPAILSPAPEGVVQPDALTFRWAPLAAVKTFTLTLFSPTRRLVWQQAGIDATKGSLTSSSARQALRRVTATERQGLFVLVLQDQYNRLQVTDFRLAPP